ncbi:hypothetical protein [Marinoscillum luteum]|uniref:YozE SAM-like domain-containing protein n=1 Tax=Marinoscillum luteum TaxID=861051 RepID=A0ABW7NEG5_9BACT
MMTFFDQVYQKLFSKPETSNEVLVYEPISRNEHYSESYAFWLHSVNHKKLIRQVAESYLLKQNNLVGEPDVHLLSTSLSNGFAISFNEEIDKKEFQFFFDWLGEKVEALPYKRSNSDVTITDKGNVIESKEKHYFKPIQQSQEAPLDQQFGNILIEHISIDNRPSFIKLVANTYNDRMYKNPDSFEVLAKYLFEVN